MPNQQQRDYEWVLSTPPLIGDSIASIPVTAESIPEIPKRKSTRVGLYFEDLVRLYLRGREDIEMMEENRQIMDGKRTLGEVDFIFRDLATGLVHHWETTVKFFLHYGESNASGSHYPGPNASDWLEKKVARITDHQWPIAKREFPEIDQQSAFVRGVIFYRREASPPLHELLNPQHQRGHWLYRREISELPQVANRASILPKPHWLAAPAVEDYQSIRESIAELATIESPRMISVLNERDQETRYFIVPDHWPEKIPEKRS